ncbi:MAG: hypothetical protein WCF57_22985 [Pyrinomonadaceae bacterium]
MKKLLTKLMLVTFLFSMPVFSEAGEALAGEETQLPVIAQTSSAALLQSISIGIGRRRRRHARRRAWRNRRWHNRSRRGRRWNRRHNRGPRIELRGDVHSH